jgi:hypothetical protein
MNFFDYIFYRSYKFFHKMPSNRFTADVQALCVVSTLQFFNLIFLNLFFSYLKKEEILPSNKFSYVGTIVVLLFINFLRYWGRSSNIKELSRRWKNENQNQKLIRGFLVTIFIILSIVLAVGSAHYVGKYFRELPARADIQL